AHQRSCWRWVFARVQDNLHRASDGARIAPNLSAILVHKLTLVLELFYCSQRIARIVPDIGIPGDHAQGTLFANASEHKRWCWLLYRFRLAICLRNLIVAASVGDNGLGPHAPDDIKRLAQSSYQFTRGVGGRAIGHALSLLATASAQAKLQPPA